MTDQTLRALVDAQAEDEGLWFSAEYASEAYLQVALRTLHAAVEAALLNQQAKAVEAPIFDPLAKLRAAKYLNPVCAEDGCQWLQSPQESIRAALAAQEDPLVSSPFPPVPSSPGSPDAPVA
jgi:hypothetical protein